MVIVTPDRISIDLEAISSRNLVETPHHLIEQIAGTAAMQGADRNRIAEAQREKLPAFILAAIIVRLVGDQNRLVASAPQPLSDRRILIEHSRCTVDHEQHEIGCLDCGLDLFGDLDVEIRTPGHPTAGIDDREVVPQPLGIVFVAISGDAGTILDDRRPLPHDPVEQGALAHVGTPDDDDLAERFGGAHDLASRARRSAVPSVGMISTGLGRSVTLMSSRNRPSADRHTSGSRYR